MYQATRYVQLQGLAVSAGHPQSGIPAGCAFATYEVQMYLVHPVDDYIAGHVSVQATIFIDDWYVEAAGKSEKQVEGALVEAADDLLFL
eukprot:10804095-Lingulodinium_polyedra.AAC.1